SYLTWPVLGLIIGSVLFIFKNPKEKLLLITWFILPFVALAFFGKVLYPRFIFFMTLPLLILAAVFLDYIVGWVKTRVLSIIIILAVVAYPLFFIWQIIFNLYQAPIPKSDRGQYLNDWPAGGGVKEALDFFTNESQKGKIAIFTDGTFGLMPYSFELYLVDHPNVKIRGVWPLEKVPEEALETAKERPTYLVTNQLQKIPPEWSLKLLAEYPKGESKIFLRIFAVIPQRSP
ncbi:MAG: hypothetical protein Q8P89_03400, partial [bacterium]|nr:hypothetical protein [bacterium]